MPIIETSRLGSVQETNLVSQISRLLTDAIVTGTLAAGERLNEVTLAREFGASRGPLREAARLLESRGLLVSHPRRGFFVRTFSARELDDFYDLRLCIEKHAAILAASSMTSDEAEALGRQIALMFELAGAGDRISQIEADFAFHRMICDFSGNKRLLQVFDDLAAESRLAIMLIGQLYDDPDRIAETHEPILEALLSKDEAQIRGAYDFHIGYAREKVVAQLREREERAAEPDAGSGAA